MLRRFAITSMNSAEDAVEREAGLAAALLLLVPLLLTVDFFEKQPKPMVKLVK